MQIILREFQNWPLRGELRGFVFQNRLIALSQYFADVCFDWTEQQKNQVLNDVSDFFQKHLAKRKMPFNDYICDFVVLGEVFLEFICGLIIINYSLSLLDDGKVEIVELNPWSETTGACLFDWKEINTLCKQFNSDVDDVDDDNDDNDNKKVAFRVVENVVNGAGAILAPWRSLLVEALSLNDAISNDQYYWCRLL
jgi:hypothetical protein